MQFNLELPDPDTFRSQLKTWRTVSSALPPAATATTTTSSSSSPSPSNGPPPLVLQVVLDSSDLTSNQTVVLSDERGRRVRVESPAAPSPEQQNRYGHAIVRPASAAGYARRPISPYPPSVASTGVGAVHGKHQSGTSSAGTRSPARGSTASANATPPIVLEQWTLNLIPFPSAEPESRRRQKTSGDAPGSHPGSSEPSPVSSATTASTSYSYPSATALPPPSPVELATVYKHSILHFRTLYSLVRTLPAFSLARTLARRRKGLATAPSGGGNRAEGGLTGSADRDQFMAGGGARPGAMTRHGAGLGVRVRLVSATSDGGSKHRPARHEGLPPAPPHEDEQDGVVAVDVSLDGGDDASSALRSAAKDGAATAKRRPTSEKIVFPGVQTPFG